MRVLITGAGGMLGRDLHRAATASGAEVVALDRDALDITDARAVDERLAHERPDVVVNCAAYTNVDGAESEEDRAHAVNGAGAGNVARAAAAAQAHVIHISSDYVFDGSKRRPYLESDAVAPLSAYGRSKLAGERAVLAGAPDGHTIVRSSWLFGTAGACFPATILRLAAERDDLRVVDDQIGCPTYTAHLSQALLALADTRSPGILHVAAAGQCSWFEFAREILAREGIETSLTPCTTEEFPRPAPRPAYSVLRSQRGDAPPMPTWQEGLIEFLSARVSAP